ncbi:hypothetical protein [Mesonia aquimarina]|nr:hypothetical protein [Mesonia aquimarina]
MKRLFLILFCMGTLATTFTSCREDKDAGDEIEEAADEVGDEAEDIVD